MCNKENKLRASDAGRSKTTQVIEAVYLSTIKGVPKKCLTGF